MTGVWRRIFRILPEAVRRRIKAIWARFAYALSRRRNGQGDLTIGRIADIIRAYSPENEAPGQVAAGDFEMDCKIEWVDNYFNIIHENDYLLFKHFTDPGETFLDIGANAGYSATSMWKAGGKMGVISFEPIAFYARHLAKIQKLAHFPYDWRICGLSDKQETLRFFTPVCNGIGLSAWTFTDIAEFKKRAEGWALNCRNHMKIQYHTAINKFGLYAFQGPVDTLDGLLAKGGFSVKTDRIAAIKIDCEGHELEVLQGGGGTIDAHRPFLMIELHRDDFDVILKSKGYIQVYRGDGATVNNTVQNKNKLCNGLYIPKDKIEYYKAIGLYVE